MSCRKVVTLLDAYADGELEPEHVLEIEGHLADCGGCSARLQLEHATRKSLRRQVYAQAEPNAAFRDRMLVSFQAEAERQEAVANGDSRRGGMLSWSSIVPLAAAAAIALLWSAKVDPLKRTASKAPTHINASTAPMNLDQVLDELIDRHIDRSSPEVTEPALLDGMEPQVGVPVHFPSLAQFGAHWEGGKVVPIRNQRAASLRFLVDGHRMTVYVYNSESFPVGTSLKRRVVRDESVYTGWKRGFSIATTDHHGVGYAVATDLGEDEGAEIVASLH